MLFYPKIGYLKGCKAVFSVFLPVFKDGLFFAIDVLHRLTEEKMLDKIQLSGEVRPKKAD